MSGRSDVLYPSIPQRNRPIDFIFLFPYEDAFGVCVLEVYGCVVGVTIVEGDGSKGVRDDFFVEARRVWLIILDPARVGICDDAFFGAEEDHPLRLVGGVLFQRESVPSFVVVPFGGVAKVGLAVFEEDECIVGEGVADATAERAEGSCGVCLIDEENDAFRRGVRVEEEVVADSSRPSWIDFAEEVIAAGRDIVTTVYKLVNEVFKHPFLDVFPHHREPSGVRG